MIRNCKLTNLIVLVSCAGVDRLAQKNNTRQQAVFPLALARTGEDLVVACIRAKKGLSHKLMEQGIRPGIIVTIIQKRGGGFVLGYDGQRIALGAGMAQKLFVSLPAAMDTFGSVADQHNGIVL